MSAASYPVIADSDSWVPDPPSIKITDVDTSEYDTQPSRWPSRIVQIQTSITIRRMNGWLAPYDATSARLVIRYIILQEKQSYYRSKSKDLAFMEKISDESNKTYQQLLAYMEQRCSSLSCFELVVQEPNSNGGGSGALNTLWEMNNLTGAGSGASLSWLKHHKHQHCHHRQNAGNRIFSKNDLDKLSTLFIADSIQLPRLPAEKEILTVAGLYTLLREHEKRDNEPLFDEEELCSLSGRHVSTTGAKKVTGLLLATLRIVVGIHLCSGDNGIWRIIAAQLRSMLPKKFKPIDLARLIVDNELAKSYANPSCLAGERGMNWVPSRIWIFMMDSLTVNAHGPSSQHPQISFAKLGSGSVHQMPVYYAFYQRMASKCLLPSDSISKLFLSLPLLKKNLFEILEKSTWIPDDTNVARLKEELQIFAQSGYPPGIMPPNEEGLLDGVELSITSATARRSAWARECCILLTETTLSL